MDFRNIKNWTIPEGNAEIVTDANDNIIWEIPDRDYSREYFFVENLSNETASVSIKKQTAAAPSIEVFYSTNRRNWTSMGTSATNPGISTTLAPGKRMYLKATTSAWGTSLTAYNWISVNKTFRIGGNILSLTKGDSYKSYTTLGANYIFTSLFLGNSNLTSAVDLKLPRNTTQNCYDSMFYNCTALADTPELPATTLTQSCYRAMFRGCKSLVTPPELPGRIADSCYRQMFYGCTHLTTAPVLPGSIASECYAEMFRNCTSLVTPPVLSATTLAQGCYSGMFRGCSSLATAPVLSNTNLALGCYGDMFRGCTALTQAPALPAITLNEHCYIRMFYGCTGLTTAPVLAAQQLLPSCYNEMFSGCSQLNNVTTYANDISASNCITNWLYGVAAQGEFHNLGTAVYITDSASGIPMGWTELNTL